MSDRKLLAIVFIDVVGFTSMASKDERNALFLLNNAVQMLKATVKRYQGRWLKQVGDGSLCSFESAVNSVLCAQEIQRCFSMNEELNLRIGIHIGDVVVSDDDIYGDGVNVASRIQNEAEVGGIVVSEEVHNALSSHPNINDKLLGETFLKGIGRGVNLYKVELSQDLPTSPVAFELQKNDLLTPRNAKVVSNISFWFGGLSVLLVALAFFVFWQKPETANVPEFSIAVLPFKNFTNDPSMDYYGEAISEEMLNVLAKSPDLHVASRTSSFDLALRDSSFKETVHTLQVNYLIEGSIRKTGDALRVTAQLIRTSDNKHLLSKSYDLVDQNWIQQQVDVSFDYGEHVGRILNLDVSKYLIKTSDVFLTKEDQKQLLDVMAQMNGIDSVESYKKLISQLEAFKDSHSNSHQAYAYLCRVYVSFYQFHYGQRQHIVKAQESCDKAHQQDPYSYSVKVAQAYLMLETGDYDKGIELAQALVTSFDNRAEPLFLLGDLYFANFQLKEGLNSYQRGFDLHSNYWQPYINLSYYLISYGEFQTASDYLNRYIELRPDDPVGYENLGVAYLYLGDMMQADKQFTRALGLLETYSNLSNIGTSKYYLGNYQQAIEYFQRALDIDDEDYRVWGNIAEAYKQYHQNSDFPSKFYLKAIDKATASLSVNSRDATTLAALAYFYSTIQDELMAEFYWKRAVQQTSQNFESHYYLAMHELNNNRIPSAINHIKASVELGYPIIFVAQAPEFKGLRDKESFVQLVNTAH